VEVLALQVARLLVVPGTCSAGDGRTYLRLRARPHDRRRSDRIPVARGEGCESAGTDLEARAREPPGRGVDDVVPRPAGRRVPGALCSDLGESAPVAEEYEADLRSKAVVRPDRHVEDHLAATHDHSVLASRNDVPRLAGHLGRGA